MRINYVFFVFVVTPGCVLYFTTDGLTPDPNNRVIDGVERTFKYKGPFKLRGGSRMVSAVALCRFVLLSVCLFLCLPLSDLPAALSISLFYF